MIIDLLVVCNVYASLVCVQVVGIYTLCFEIHGAEVKAVVAAIV